jgi:hypothetical protein
MHRRAAKLIRMAPAGTPPKIKTPPAPEDTDGVFHAFTSGKVAALELKTSLAVVSFRPSRNFFPRGSRFCRLHPLKPSQNLRVVFPDQVEEVCMKKALAILATVATVGATSISAPAQARGLGPGLAFGLAAGAIAAGVAGAYGPYYYGPGYGYYGPRYYGYGGPVVRYGYGYGGGWHRGWHHERRW